jgi:hypothetical protein
VLFLELTILDLLNVIDLVKLFNIMSQLELMRKWEKLRILLELFDLLDSVFKVLLWRNFILANHGGSLLLFLLLFLLLLESLLGIFRQLFSLTFGHGTFINSNDFL